MNFVFVSPQFPATYWNFCDRLRQRGVNVLGLGDTPEFDIAPELRRALNEYYWVPSLESYADDFRALAYFSWQHGKIDWIESNNEYWLPIDARLRDDFHVTTGASAAQMARWQSKADMKPLYAAGGVPTARQIRDDSLDEARGFAWEVGYPLFAKPERGVGSGGARKLADEAALEAFFASERDERYVIEEYVTGDICSYDAILDSHGEPLFENQNEFPPSMAEVVEKQLDCVYHTRPTVDPKLAALGRAAAKGFGLTSRFVHMEFFRLSEAKPGLGEAGDYVGLEVNVRPPGGYTPDMMNFAHSTDVYTIWADMVVSDRRLLPDNDDLYFCCYVGRRDGRVYVHSHEEIWERYGDRIVMCDRIPDALADDLGNQMYMARLRTDEERLEYEQFVTERA